MKKKEIRVAFKYMIIFIVVLLFSALIYLSRRNILTMFYKVFQWGGYADYAN